MMFGSGHKALQGSLYFRFTEFAESSWNTMETKWYENYRKSQTS